MKVKRRRSQPLHHPAQETPPNESGFIVKSLAGDRQLPVTDNTADAYCLAEISISVKQGKLPLPELFKKMHAHISTPVDAKAEETTVKQYFLAAVPEIDLSRVHTSDMRNILKWYNILKEHVDFGEDVHNH